jgi:Niemann-Pick C1 protein
MRAFSEALDAAEGMPLFTPHGKGEDYGEKEPLDGVLQRKFRCAARIVATHPWTTILVCYAACAACSAGMIELNITSDPEKIWVPPGSASAVQEQYFNNYFQPFFRTEVMIFTTPNRTVNMISKEYLERVMAVQTAINTTASSTGAVLNDLCFKPIIGKGCMVGSPLNYWRDNLALLEADTDIPYTLACIPQSVGLPYVPCNTEIGIPVIEELVFGGLACDPTVVSPDPCSSCVPSARALIVTFLLENTAALAGRGETWEHDVFLDIAARAARELAADPVAPMLLSYMAERSIADELEVEDMENEFVVVVSYGAMFLYIAVALGKFPHPVRTRALLGLQGIVIVMLSVASALGVCSVLGLPITMIVTEVVPFLILAIGVDNMFIIVKAYDRTAAKHPGWDVADVLSQTAAEVGPSITAAAVSECLAFAVGAATDIPALQGFCIIASVAVAFDYALQMTLFMAAVALDARRQRAHRCDVLLFEVPADTAAPASGTFWRYINEGHFVRTVIDRYYVPLLLRPAVKAAVLLLFAGLLGVSGYAMTQLKLGLEQQLVLPSDSYMQGFFDAQASLMDIGSPAYIVLHDVDYESDTPAVYAAANVMVQSLALLTDVIEPPVYSWLQGFEAWDRDRDYINNNLTQYCPPSPPAGTPFPHRVSAFLNLRVDQPCCQNFAYCGAQYAQDVRLGNDTRGVLRVLSSKLRTQHRPLRDQADFINSMEETQAAVTTLALAFPRLNQVDTVAYPGSDKWGAAFPYSLFYVYYDQYSYIRGVAVQNLLVAVAAVFFAVLCVASPAIAGIVGGLILCITVDIIGLLWLFNPAPAAGDFTVDINAVSVVNLVMAVGLSVEFVVHIATAYASHSGTPERRVRLALSQMGASVVTGITFTKFIGVLVLAFAPSRLFRLYYFQMYLAIIIGGAFHGLAVLPVLLTLFNPAPSDGKFNHAVPVDKALTPAVDEPYRRYGATPAQ